MEILQPGKVVSPKEFFITDCKTISGSGCGAILKVFPEDCFQYPGCDHLSFYCAHCGLILTPDNRVTEEYISHLPDELREKYPVKNSDNVPPWAVPQFPTFEEFNAKHDIKWRYR